MPASSVGLSGAQCGRSSSSAWASFCSLVRQGGIANLSGAPPTYGPPPATQRRRRGGVVGPLILIFLGGVFLLQNTGYLPPNFWFNLWRLWPVILVLVGIELLLANRVPW